MKRIAHTVREEGLTYLHIGPAKAIVAAVKNSSTRANKIHAG